MDKSQLAIPAHFETRRLILRGYQPGDGQWYYVMSQKNQAHLARYETDNPVMTIQSPEQAESVVRAFAADWIARDSFFLAALDKVTLEFAGQIYIGPVNWDLPEFTIGYFVDKDHEGRGYITEAVKASLKIIFEYLNAQRVRLVCDDTNLRSARVAERCGFVREGHLRQNKKHADGTITGTLLFGILRDEYLSQFSG